MTNKHNGGPAFPQMRVWNASLGEYEDTQQYPGMTLRDWFAGQTAAAITGGLVVASVEEEQPASVAEAAYALADAMIAVRAK